jgi:hypothetical protein
MQRVSDSAPSQYAKEQSLAAALKEDPGNSPNWRLHKNACPYYRERWFPEHDPTAGEPMYQVFCMKNTPPVTSEEQDKCLHSRFACWRMGGKAGRPQPQPAQKVKSSSS